MRHRTLLIAALLLLIILAGAGTLAATARHRDSAIVATVSLNGAYPFEPVVDTRTGRMFVLATAGPMHSPHGELRMLDAATGDLHRTLPLAYNVAFGGAPIVDERTGHVIVDTNSRIFQNVAAPGMVSVVDIQSARIVRTVAVGSNAQSLLLDPAARRLLVMSTGSYVPVSPPDPWGWLPGGLRQRLAFLPSGPPRQLSPRLTILDMSRL